MKTLCRMLIYTLSFFPIHSIGQTLTSSNATNEGGALQLINPLKTANNIANNWTLYNMTGAYGNSLQFWNYGNGGFYGSRFTILDNGKVGIGTTTPIAQLSVNGDGYFKAADDRSGIGALTIETINGTNLKLGGNTTYSWIQSHNSKPLYINELGNNTIFNLVGGNVGIGTNNPTLPLTVYGKSVFFPARIGSGDARSLEISNSLSNYGFVSTDYPVIIKTGGGDQPLVFDAARVGVGTQNPLAKLEINRGNVLVKNAINVDGNSSIMISQSIIDGNLDSFGTSIRTITQNAGSNIYGMQFFTQDSYLSGQTEKVRILGNGNVGIGTTNPTSKLTVAGNINSREVKVSVDAGADFVFEKDYALPSLQEVEKFVTENKHLPEIASAKEMQREGVNLSEMNIKLLQKIEELTLYMIEQNKRIELQQKKYNSQSKEMEILKKEVESIKLLLNNK